MVTAKEQFTGQASPELLASLREIARSEGRDFEATLEDAMRLYVKGGEKMYRAGGPIAWFGRRKTVPPVAFHRADFQPLEGAMDVSRGDVLSGSPGLPGGGDERNRRLYELLAQRRRGFPR